MPNLLKNILYKTPLRPISKAFARRKEVVKSTHYNAVGIPTYFSELT
jgi:hypothetical protein